VRRLECLCGVAHHGQQIFDGQRPVLTNLLGQRDWPSRK
jgi:hypothetical protein